GAAAAASALPRTDPSEKLGMNTAPVPAASTSGRTRAIRSADQPDVPTSTLTPRSTAARTTSMLTAGTLASTTRSAPSSSSSPLREVSTAAISKSSSPSTTSRITAPSLPVPPTRATRVVMPSSYSGRRRPVVSSVGQGLGKSGAQFRRQMCDVVVGDQAPGPAGLLGEDGQAAVGLIEGHPSPFGHLQRLAHEPGDDEVVGDQKVVRIAGLACQELADRIRHLGMAGFDLLLGDPSEERLEDTRGVGRHAGGDAVEKQRVRLGRHRREPLRHDLGGLRGPL